MTAPLVHSYNLGRLGNGGDEVHFEANESELAAIATLAEVLALSRFTVTVTLKKASPTCFLLDLSGWRLAGLAKPASSPLSQWGHADLHQCLHPRTAFCRQGP